MGLFHLHRRSSSSHSTSSALSSTSSRPTPRTSTDSADYMTATIKPHFNTRAPLLDLPFEVLQQITSYLDDASAAKFSLSTRQVCYAIGTQRLATYIASAPSRFDARSRLEATIERALPGAWHCAWCDKFHVWTALDGPATRSQALHSPCAEYNSYLTDAAGYTLRYHHVRLALAAHKFGPAHGLPLSRFTHASTARITLFGTPIHTATTHTAKIVNARFLLHSSTTLLLPAWAARHTRLATALFPLLPAALTQHRATSHGHSGLLAALDNAVRRGWRIPNPQPCADCASDWSIAAFAIPRSAAGEFVRLHIQAWRDLGTAATPFCKLWRAHGAFFPGKEEGSGWEEGGRERERERLPLQGSVKTVFESGAAAGEAVSGDEVEAEPQPLEYSWLLDRRREDATDQEMEWRAIWRYVERRAGVEAGTR